MDTLFNKIGISFFSSVSATILIVIEKYGWKNVDDLKEFLETDGMNESLWDKTLEVTYRYNRLVLFRPWMFHSPGKNFGDTKENCRVLQTFFLGQE
jgi:hypothetical protein